MKVLHIIGGGDVGGAKVHVLSLVNELRKNIDVKLISLRPGPFAVEALALGIDVTIVKSHNIFKDIKNVVKIIKSGNYELVHSHGAKANMISVLCRLFTKIPTVTTVHSDYKLDYLENLFKRISFGVIKSISLRHIKYYIGVSKKFKRMLISRKFDEDKIFTVYNGIDFNKHVNTISRNEFSKKYNLNINNDDLVIGTLARLHPVKDLDTFLFAAKMVLKQNTAVKFIIGGDGEQLKHLETLILDLGLSENVFVPGWIDDSYGFMDIIDINVISSLSESFPFTILEAARLKKVTISTKVGGIPDLIKDGVNGFLFAPRDYKRLARCINKLITDNDLRNYMGQNIYVQAKELFSLDSMCQTQLDIYKHILDIEQKKLALSYKYDVILSGYYGFKNMGDDAMLLSIIKNLKINKKDIRILVLSKVPIETTLVYGVDSISRINSFKIIKNMRKCKLFINGGGNLIQDNTSTRSLIYYLSLIWLAKKMSMKVMLYGNGIGPLSKKYNRKLTSHILNKIDIISLREEISHTELKKLNINKPKVYISADPVLSLRSASDSKIKDILLSLGIYEQSKLIGFSIRDWRNSQNSIEILSKIADYVIENYALIPVFLPMHSNNDIYVINKIVSNMKYKSYVIVNNKDYEIPIILGIIKRLNLMIGMRLHSLVFAISVGVPVIGLAYEQKINGFMDYIQQSSVQQIKDLSYEKLKDMIDSTIKNRDALKKSIDEHRINLKQKSLLNATLAIDLLENFKK